MVCFLIKSHLRGNVLENCTTAVAAAMATAIGASCIRPNIIMYIHGQTHLISMNEGIVGVSVLAPWANFTFAAAALLLLPDTKRARPTYLLESTNVIPSSKPCCLGSNAPTAAVESLQLWPVGSIPTTGLNDQGTDGVEAT